MARDDSRDKKMRKSDQSKISTIPDAVLHHILSFLDMKEVMTSSLLSRRWRYLWVFMPVLNFNDSLWGTEEVDGTVRRRTFMNFVDQILLLHDFSSISKFRITCSSYCDSDRIDTWLTVAARREFQETHLELLVNQPMEWPRLLLSSSVTVLKLDVKGSSSPDDIQIPSWVCFSPLLKTLSLCSVRLPEGNSVGELVFCNPALENLTLKQCNQAHLELLTISANHLKTLVYENYTNRLLDSCPIKICTPNLESIDIGGTWYVNYCLENLSSLLSAEFHFTDLPADQYLVNVLEHVSCPTTIRLSDLWNFDEELLTGKLNRPYTNVKCLKFDRWGSNRGYSTRTNDLYLLNLLRSFPCLETLCLDIYREEEEDEYTFPPTFHHLKNVEIKRLSVQRNELKLLEFLLKNAIILEKLVIRLDTPLILQVMGKERELKIRQTISDKIHSLARTSARLSIVLL